MSLRRRFKLGEWTVTPLEGRLSNGDIARRVQPKSMDVLLRLAEAAGEVVARDALLREVWGDRAQSDEPLTRCIGDLRRALGDTADQSEYILTVPKRGYRLLKAAVPLPDPAEDSAEAMLSPSPVQRLARMDTLRKLGIGLVVLVLAATVQIGVESLLDRPASDDGPGAMTRDIPPRSVAVLPFVNIGGGTDDEYFADGLTEEVLNALTQLSELFVTARSSSFYFKGRDLPLQEVAGTLGVAHIVEGTVRRERDRLRVTARLTRAADGFNLWSDTFDRGSDGLLTVQIEIAEQVAAALNVVLDDARRERMRSAGLRDPAALIAFQKGLEITSDGHSSEQMLVYLAEANEYFETALALAPEFSDAYVQHSDFYTHALLDLVAGRELEVDTDAETARSILRRDFDAAVRYARNEQQRIAYEFDRALVGDSWAGLSEMIGRLAGEQTCISPIWLPVVAMPFGRQEEALSVFRRHVACDPLDFRGPLLEIRALIWLGRYEESLAQVDKTLNTFPVEIFHTLRFEALLAGGQFDAAEAVVERDLGQGPIALGAKLMLAAARGDADLSRALLQRFRDLFGISGEDLIHLHSIVGDRETANRVAAYADAEPFGHMVLGISIMNCYCGAPFDLESTPNFARKLDEAGFAWPPQQAIEWPLKDW